MMFCKGYVVVGFFDLGFWILRGFMGWVFGICKFYNCAYMGVCVFFWGELLDVLRRFMNYKRLI